MVTQNFEVWKTCMLYDCWCDFFYPILSISLNMMICRSREFYSRQIVHILLSNPRKETIKLNFQQQLDESLGKILWPISWKLWFFYVVRCVALSKKHYEHSSSLRSSPSPLYVPTYRSFSSLSLLSSILS